MAYSLIDSYGRWWRMKGGAETTLVNYRSSLRMFVRDVLEGDELGLLSAECGLLEAYVDRRLEQSVNAAHSDVRALKSFYRWAVEFDEVDVSPARRLRLPKVDEPPVRVATTETLDALIAACGRDKLGRRNAAIVAVMLSGPRRGELCSLDLEHLDIEGGWLSIPRTKGGSPRRIPLHPKAVVLIERYLRLRGDAPGPLFVGRTGERLKPNGLGQVITRLSRKAGVEFASHDARRMLAETLVANHQGAVAPAVLGWRGDGARMLARYTRTNRETIGGAVVREMWAATG